MNGQHTHHCIECNKDFECQVITHCRIEEKENKDKFITQICPFCDLLKSPLQEEV